MAIDVEKEVIKTTLKIRDIRNMEDDDARQVEKVVAALVTRAVAEAVKPYEEAVSAHNSKMDKVPKMETRPKTPAGGLRFLARWFDAMYPDDLDTAVQDDLRRWANEWDNAVADAKREQMEADCRAACTDCREYALDNIEGGGGIGEAFQLTPKTWTHIVGRSLDPAKCRASAIRTAFAASEPRDAAKDDARELGLDGAA